MILNRPGALSSGQYSGTFEDGNEPAKTNKKEGGGGGDRGGGGGTVGEDILQHQTSDMSSGQEKELEERTINLSLNLQNFAPLMLGWHPRKQSLCLLGLEQHAYL